jgi:hypothetical protein
MPLIRLRLKNLAIVAALLAPTSVARAQAVGAPAPGDRVRVTAPSIAIDRRAAQLVARDGDTLHLLFPGGANAVAVPASAITQLEVSRGTYRPVAHHGLAGLAVGATLGVVIGMFENTKGCGQQLGFSCGEERSMAMFAMGVIGGAVGGVVGIMVGSAPVERWQPAPLDTPPQRQGYRGASPRKAAVSLSLRF